MCIYAIITLFSVFFQWCGVSYKSRQWKIISIIIACLGGSFSLFLSLNGNDLYDRAVYYSHYVNFYKAYSDDVMALLATNFQQIGWMFYNWIFSYFGIDINWLFFLTSFMYIYTTERIFENALSTKGERVLAVVLLFGSLVIIYSSAQVRQFLAALILNLIFLHLLSKNRLIISLILIIIDGLLIHVSALFGLIVVFIYLLVRINRNCFKFLIIVSLGFVILLPLVLNIVSSSNFVYNTMKGTLDSNQSSWLALFKGLPLLIYCIIGMVYRGALSKKMSVEFYITVSWLGFLCWVASAYLYWFWRLDFYLAVINIIFCVKLYYIIKINYVKYIIMLCIVYNYIFTFREIFLLYPCV